MTDQANPKNQKRFPIIRYLLLAVFAGVVLAAGGFGFAATQETHDSFCASCHTQPESTFYQRSADTQPVDLASYHTTQMTRCIDCHSGQGVAQRMRAELMGARNAFLWYTGQAVQPAVLTVPIGDQNCLKCHQTVTQRGFTPQEQITVPGVRGERRGGEEGGNNHWHELLARWQATSPNAGTCTSCHGGHSTGSTAQAGFMDGTTVQSVCEGCHQVLRRGREGGG